MAIKRKTPLKSKSGFKKKSGLLRPSRIKQVSKRRAKEYQEYYKLRRQYLLEHPICEACNRGLSTQIHHKARRYGKLLCDVRYFMSVCADCHVFIENNGKYAEEKGWILRRIKQ